MEYKGSLSDGEQQKCKMFCAHPWLNGLLPGGKGLHSKGDKKCGFIIFYEKKKSYESNILSEDSSP